ncbi:Cof-type HAD-IIB family hydrolase [Bengtsoniella intestinalis]|uniref:Cof-type HAD-IIB family hydrolase n=1 Tax=Bengtsoniella intestinalis TaxID=3073143 RepID=UPI00391F1FDA
MNKPAMILFDLDGTVLNTNKEISPRTRAALEAAVAQGIEIVPATGRFFKAMPQVVMDLPFRYAITVNGAAIYDRETQSVLHSETIDNATTLAVFDELDTMDGIYDCYYDGWGYMEQTQHAKAEEYVANSHIAKMVSTFRTPVADIRTFLGDKAIEKTQIFLKSAEERAEQLKALPVKFPDLKITSSVPGNIEINSQNANKGYAMETLCRLLNLDPTATVAFGDDLNDATMIASAGLGVAMGNGVAEIIAIANRTAPTNDEDGVAVVIEELLASV